MHGNGLSMENLLNLKIKKKVSLNNARIMLPEFLFLFRENLFREKVIMKLNELSNFLPTLYIK